MEIGERLLLNLVDMLDVLSVVSWVVSWEA